MLDDLWRIGLVALAVNLLLLIVFLRALIAPLYLVAVSVLGLAASLGLTTFVFQGVLGYDDLTYYVPFAAAVLLVALGSDYNVFVAGRIWEEARWLRLREAIAVATPAAAKAVTVAGIALAASFALLALVPLRSFREFAFVMGAGVLIDTFVARSLLVPALTSLFGEAAWWPGRRLRGMSARRSSSASPTAPACRGRRPAADRGHAGRARRADHAARARACSPHHLPRELRAPLEPSRESERFSVGGVPRARARPRGRRAACRSARCATTPPPCWRRSQEATPDNLAYVRAQLSDDYDALFPTPAPVEADTRRAGHVVMTLSAAAFPATAPARRPWAGGTGAGTRRP